MKLNGNVLLFIVLMTAGCAVGPGTTPGSGNATKGNEPTVAPTRITIAISGEVSSLASKYQSAGVVGSEFSWLSNSTLAVDDQNGVLHPFLAAALPSTTDGTWVVNQDGTMTTAWTIRPNARWHDGHPVVAADFIFALQTYLDPAIVVNSRMPVQLMDHVEQTGPQAFTIYWSQPYPWAAELTRRAFDPLPQHLMGHAYETMDAQTFQADPFWSSERYVGEGPYRLLHWENGSELVYQAFADYFPGKPHIDEVHLRIISDPNLVVTALLSGVVDVTLGNQTLSKQAAVTVRDRWAEIDGGRVFTTPVSLQIEQIQRDPSRVGQAGLLDVRVRRALMFALDRESLAETSTAGLYSPADVPLPPNDPAFSEVRQAATTYAFDPKQARQLLQDAGWISVGGTWMDSQNQPLSVDLRTSPSDEQEMAIIAYYFDQIGVRSSQTVNPNSLTNDVQYHATFPGLQSTAFLLGIPMGLQTVTSAQCTSAERRYAGLNRGCWLNPEYDRLYLTASTAFDPSARTQAAVNAIRILSADVGYMPLHYMGQALAVRKGITGPAPFWAAQGGASWNIQDWEIIR